ncbi:MAG: hypothetical protein WCC49_15405, partial [Pantoea agglomerans]
VVSSPSQKLDIWIDNVKSKNATDWCVRELPLRIVAKGKKDPEVLDDFLPRVGNLLQRQCGKMESIHWQMTDSAGSALAKGTAAKVQAWAVKVEPEAPVAPPETPPAAQTAPAAPPAVAAEDLSPPADTTPWMQFSLLDGCHFRTYFRSGSQTSALFVPAKGGVSCGSDGWLSGESQIAQLSKGASKNVRMTFLQGFPVSGLTSKALSHDVQITTVNNERMVLSDEKSPQSWMVVPFDPSINGWKTNGTVVVEITAGQASDESDVKARLNEVRKVWSPYLADKSSLTVKLVQELHPQLKDPAAGSFRTIN